MKERPILFSAPMVRAILEGRKTQTRRVAKQTANGHLKQLGGHRRWHPADPEARLASPYGQPGDRLWVREAWAYYGGDEYLYQQQNECVWYRAHDIGDPVPGVRWRPSIHMPRWASRITLEVTGVRVERLQDISEADAVAEGIEAPPPADPVDMPVWRYRQLWGAINGPKSWQANPWVWVVEFKRVQP
jgi:hypothetical protein